MAETGIILLAAGSSSRLGQAKQQLLYQGKTLLQHAVQTACATGIRNVLVVLGASAESLLSQFHSSSQVQVVQNTGWAEGMASSIRLGLTELQKSAPQTSQALFMLCDQPFVSADLLNEMVHLKQESGKRIVACSYQNTLGAPVLFDKWYFPELLLLQGQEGAKKILAKHPQDIAALSSPQGAIDIDTPSDYTSLLQNTTTPN